MRKINFYILIISLFFSLLEPLFSEEIVLGGEDGWSGISMMNSRLNTESGSAEIQLADNEYPVTPDTEMLFHFNGSIFDEGGLYKIKQNQGVRLSDEIKRKGEASAVFPGDNTFLELIPSDTALFAAGSGKLTDFCIEFWLNPSRLSEGEHIIQWTGAVSAQGKTYQQEILCGISDRNMFWDFINIFLTPQLGETKFTLISSRSLIPKRWHHHMLRYDSSIGLLEYLIDGVPEDMVYTTPTGKEQAEIYSSLIGAAKPSRFMVGRGYTGYLDELRITGEFSSPDLNRFSMSSGTVVSDIIDLDYSDSRFLKLDADYTYAGKTQIHFFYRLSNRYFHPDAEYPQWIQLEPGEILSPDEKGKYIQIMAELYPDGTGINSPLLKSMTINYEKNLPPLPPAYLSAKAGNGKAVLNWSSVTDVDVAGYRIYYGTKPGIYFGKDAAAGESPIDAGKTLSIEIDGLKNGILYYFTVTSYDNAEEPHESIFSREVSVRPSAIIRE